MKTQFEKKAIVARFMELDKQIFEGVGFFSWCDSPFYHTNEPTKEKVLQNIIEYSKYDTSWEWLMPVIGKLSKITEEPEELDPLKYALLCNDINTAFETVWDFINEMPPIGVEPIPEFKAVFNPITGDLAVLYGDTISTYTFRDQDEWVGICYNGDGNHPNWLDIHVDYDERLNLCFYPRTNADESLNEYLGTHYNTSGEDAPDNLKVVFNNDDWDRHYEHFLGGKEAKVFNIHDKRPVVKKELIGSQRKRVAVEATIYLTLDDDKNTSAQVSDIFGEMNDVLHNITFEVNSKVFDSNPGIARDVVPGQISTVTEEE